MSAVRITRSRHPLRGQQLQVLGQRCRQGRLELLLVLPDGSKSLIPADWTDFDDAAGIEEAVDPAGAAALGSLADLLHASTVIGALVARSRRGQEQAARQSSCEEDNRAACAAESDAGAGAGASSDVVGPASRSAGRRRGRGVGRSDRQDRHPKPAVHNGRGGRR
jgi:hypothetical protein